MPFDKEKDLKLKYQYIPEDAANEPAKKTKKAAKKANHKHVYEPIVIDYCGKYSGWTDFYGSYCPICGKVNIDSMGTADKELDKLFPKVARNIFFLKYAEHEQFEEYCRAHYKHIVMRDFDPYKTKYLPLELIFSEWSKR